MSGSVCVIGAGPAGLSAAKALKDKGIAFDCFEKGSNIGGLWRFQNDSGQSAAYQSLHINTSKKRTQFADFPMPEAYPDFPHHTLMLRYFEDYTETFGLRPHIRFGSTVEQVRTQEDGTFGVVWQDAQRQSHRQVYEAVIVANGHHARPHLPDFAGSFSGRTLHSHEYESADSLAGQRVLVVGMGNSGCDIACESSRVSARTFLSTRRGAHIIPKYLLGKPLDQVCPPAAWRYLPRWLFQRFFGMILRLARGRQEKMGVPKPEHGILSEHPTISSDLINLIGHGRVRMKSNIRELAGDHVVFADGSRERIDVVVYATGYDIHFPFFDDDIVSTDDNRIGLYKMVVHPTQQGLYFVGLIQPWGSIMPLAEAQSKWIAELLEGSVGLPSIEKMRQEVARNEIKMQKRYTDSRRHTVQVDFYPYLDAISKERKRWRGRGVAIPLEGRRAKAA